MMGMVNRVVDWVDARLPVVDAYKRHMSEYYAPKNFNFWYYFGVLSLVVLINQLLTGIWLTMFFSPNEGFASVEYIMRDVEWGWLIRYMHAVGASAFFAVVYIHMFRGLMYGSYKPPRELVWIFGMLIYLALMAEGFLGYVLPWGNMSYWGAQVIISLAGAIPFDLLPFISAAEAKEIGEGLTTWVRGDYLLSTATVNKFFALHVVAIPIVLLALVVLHILALHEVGSNNPDGVEIKQNKDENGVPVDGIPFHPYYTVKDLPGVIVFLMIFSVVIFFFPDGGGYLLEKPNFEPANPLKTPDHIAPVWYYGPYYAMLRATTIDIIMSSKAWGLVAMGGAIVILFVIPWLDRHPVKSIRYRGIWSKIFMTIFVVDFLVLGFLGTQPATPTKTMIAQFGTVYYFSYFLLIMPFVHKFEKSKPVPERVTGGH
ncbi:MAG: cytochrome b [Alcanivoracaceae bacterium]|uniref:Cytochrome b n=1 Tax=Alcanivorax profundi TaxID=2338368 RepID=A0A418XVS3_9GAMM|nr:cytochrome B [Alcanivorax sp. P2S70]MAX55295.1 cytochrome b [Alcanivoracaceae bacterium]RJG16823.1 cytochrome b [Alcanivorax profundi]